MALLDFIRWQGVGRTYTLPWMRNRIEYCADPAKIAIYAKGDFTRSRMLQKLLTQFHLSNNSILVSNDEHATFLKKKFVKYLPPAAEFASIARNIVESVFVGMHDGQPRTVRLISPLIRETYASLLSNVLGIEMHQPLQQHVEAINLQPYWRPLQVEGLMYSVGMHLPVFFPVRALFDLLFFRKIRNTRRTARKLEKLIVRFSSPRDGGWYAALLELKAAGRITQAQFSGEITSMLVSAFSVSSAVGSMLLCLAARPEYADKINQDPALIKAFVNEVLRLYPPFRQFGYERKPFSGGAFPMTDTTDFMVAAFALHRDRAAWNKPDEFLPERFLEPGATGGFKYLPFGMRERACPGRSYSMLLLAEILKLVCSDTCGLQLSLPANYVGTEDRMPIGISGRLVSFPVDDRITYRRLISSHTAPALVAVPAEQPCCPFSTERRNCQSQGNESDG